jgi:hypothetical protein
MSPAVCNECGVDVLRPGLCRGCRNHQEVMALTVENMRLQREIDTLREQLGTKAR